MQTALEALRQRRAAKPEPAAEEITEKVDIVAEFFGPQKPELPAELLVFELMHRHAVLGGLPQDKAAEIIGALHAAADCPKRAGLLWQSRLEDLQELDVWFRQWLDEAYPVVGEDLFGDD